MSKIKSKEEFKERDEIEEYFGEIKNKSFPSWIFLILFLFVIIGILGYYYFIIDNPKNILSTALNKTFLTNTNNISKYNNINYEFNLDTNIITTNEEYIGTSNIIKEIAYSGVGKIDLINKENITKLNTFYKGNKLLNIDLYSKDNNIYLQVEELYDKVIKFNNETTNKNSQEYNVEIDNFKLLVNSLKEELALILNKSSYQKEYTKIDSNYVKKITLIIDKKFQEKLYNNLLNNNDFLKSYSKLMGISKSDVKDELNEIIDNLDNNEITINLYLSILKNKFIMFETIESDERTIITKEENKYNYKIYNNSIIEYQGFIEVIKNNHTYEISCSLDNVEEELSVILNLDISFNSDRSIEKLNINNTINYQDLTEQDGNEILNNLEKNKTILSLFEDINSLYQEEIPSQEEQPITTA